jgi:peptide/nickel transport system permease protein
MTAGAILRRRPGMDRLRAGTSASLARAIAGNRKALAGLTVIVIFAFMSFFPGVLAHDNPGAEIYKRSAGPSAAHLLGTTSYGQDVFAQWVFGTRESLVIAIVAGGLATVLSVLIGVSAAYRGGFVDGVLSLFTDVFLVIPAFPLVVIIAAYSKNGGNAILIAVLVVTGWSYGARQLRSQALSLRSRDFLVAARIRGERQWRIIVFEIIPTMTSLIVANFLGAAVYAVLAAAGLQFIGLGNPDAMSWGTMLFWAQNNEALQAGTPLWAIVPGVSIALLGGALALLNYAFDEIGNPALRPVRRKRG